MWPDCSGVYRPVTLSVSPLVRSECAPAISLIPSGKCLGLSSNLSIGAVGVREELRHWDYSVCVPEAGLCLRTRDHFAVFPQKASVWMPVHARELWSGELLSVFIILCRNTGINIFMDYVSWFANTVCTASLTWLYFSVTDMGMSVSFMGITKNVHPPTWPCLPPISLWV